jgi:hypothetical protein
VDAARLEDLLDRLFSLLAPSGLPKASSYPTGFAVMACGLVLAALAGALMPSPGRLRHAAGEEPAHAGLDILAGGTVVGDQSE